MAPDLARVAARALEHPAPEVQADALDLITRAGDLQGDPELGDRLAAVVDLVAATVRPRLLELLPEACAADPPPAMANDLEARSAALPPDLAARSGVTATWDALATGKEPPPLDLAHDGVPRLSPERGLAPLTDADAILDLLARALENATSATDIERLCDGISRAAGTPLDDDLRARATPIVHRATEILMEAGADDDPRFRQGPFLWLGLELDLAALALAWLERHLVAPEALPRVLHPRFSFDFPSLGAREVVPWHRVAPLAARLNDRLIELAHRATAGHAQPLLSMPTDARGWIDVRVLRERLAQQLVPAPADLRVALQRLAPDHREEARASLADCTGEAAAALRMALASPPTALAEDVPKFFTPVQSSLCALALPADPEVLFAVWRPVVLDSQESTATLPIEVEFLFHPDEPMGHHALALIVELAGFRLPESARLGRDLLSTGIEDGRITGAMIATAVHAALEAAPRRKGAQRPKPKRWLDSLAEIAKLTALHRHAVLEAIQQALPAIAAESSRPPTGWLELLLELTTESGSTIAGPELRALLTGLQDGKGKTAELARKLLAREDSDASASSEALSALLDARLERAERWQGLTPPASQG